MKIFFATLFFMTAMVSAQTSKNLGDFDSVKVFDRLNVELIPSSENKITMSGSRASEVEVVNKNGELKIRMKLNRILEGEDVEVKLYFKRLESVDASEGSVITASSPFSQTSLQITAKEGATISLKLEVSKATVKSVTGGIVKLSGKATNLQANLGTGGILEAKNLATTQTSVKISAGGEADVNASELVDANVNAGGNVRVFGSPKQINKKTALGGTITESR